MDEITPGFTRLQECGKFLPLNPVDIVTVTETRVPATGSHDTYKISPSVHTNTTWGSLCGTSITWPFYLSVPGIDNSLVDLVVTSARANAANFEWDVLTFLAELEKSVDEIAAVGRAFNNLTAFMAEKAVRTRRNPYQVFRELWLWSRYSVRPMMYDVLNAAQALASDLSDHELIRGRGSHSTDGSDSHVQINLADGGNYQQTLTETIQWSRTYRSMVYMDVGEAIHHRFGTDILQTAWELIPYSFVVDWFINIGRWVSTVRPTLLGQWKGQCVSIQTNVTQETLVDTLWLGLSGVPSAGYRTSGALTGGSRKVVSKEYVRYPYSGLPLPSVNPRITLPKLIDLVALFVRGRNRTMRILSRR